MSDNIVKFKEFLKENVEFISDTANKPSYETYDYKGAVYLTTESRGYPKDAERFLKNKMNSQDVVSRAESFGLKLIEITSGEGDDCDYPGDHASASAKFA
jgi:hypothetical protein